LSLAMSGALDSDREARRAAANELFKAGQFQEAVAAYSGLIEEQPEAVLFSNRALCRMRLQDYSGALGDADAGLALGETPVVAKLNFTRARALLELGKFEEAAEAARSLGQVGQLVHFTSSARCAQSSNEFLLQWMRSGEKYLEGAFFSWTEVDGKPVKWFPKDLNSENALGRRETSWQAGVFLRVKDGCGELLVTGAEAGGVYVEHVVQISSDGTAAVEACKIRTAPQQYSSDVTQGEKLLWSFVDCLRSGELRLSSYEPKLDGFARSAGLDPSKIMFPMPFFGDGFMGASMAELLKQKAARG